MRILKITYQNRRDFCAIFVCEHCGYKTKEQWGYDDTYFHSIVIPNMKCEKCDKIASEDYRSMTTKYPEGMQI